MKRTIQNLIASYSFNQVEQQYRNGQLSQLQFEAYCRVWEWISPRFGGQLGWRQDRYWQHHGKEAFYNKINRVRVAFGYLPLKTV